jgi:hypothetical protein
VRRALAPRRSLAGEQGSAVVLTLVLLATLTSGSVIWMTRELSSTVAARTLALEVATSQRGPGLSNSTRVRCEHGERFESMCGLPRRRSSRKLRRLASRSTRVTPFTLELVGVAVDGARVTTEIEVRGAGAPVTVSGRAWAMGEGDR